MSDDDFDCDGTHNIICPWCGYHYDDTTDFCRSGRSEEYDCDNCEKPFLVEPDYDVTYSTSKVKGPA